MANLKILKERISSVASTQKITSAMKMVAASKLRRAQEQAEAARPFSERMSQVMASVAGGMPKSDDMPKLLAGTGKDDTYLIVLATSERGLCGGFNANLVRAARSKIQDLQGEGKKVSLLCIGKKGRDMLGRDFSNLIIDTIDMSAIRRIAFSDATPISDRVMSMFDAGDFDVCLMFYSHFKSVMEQIVTEHQLIPVAVADDGASALEDGGTYDAEPGEMEILADLLPRNLAIQVFHGLLENAASEQGARMTAMDSATRNASDMIDGLTLTYNRARQAAITTELIEIIAGAEAV
ncbi:MAG: F0F1 ATP synthase subunit gamma [Alphaproteobacteria bacterium]|nr:F0F1 ATP synthase subunit gamma [Alphaproteobacteria bacterium]